jgi:predicted DCC family thiol-disulfide oxidoreductase YuxK
MEVNFLKKRDIKNKIKFTDLQSPDYNPSEHGMVNFAEGMRKLRAVLPDGKVITGVEVFRQTYEAIGLGWVFEVTKLPVLGKVADYIYDVWSENRLRLTGRSDLADELKKVAEELVEADEVSCDSDACGIDYDTLDDSKGALIPTAKN